MYLGLIRYLLKDFLFLKRLSIKKIQLKFVQSLHTWLVLAVHDIASISTPLQCLPKS